MPHPSDVVDLAQRLASSCRCNWQAADRSRLITYLAPLLPVQPADLPIALRQTGSTWVLDKQTAVA